MQDTNTALLACLMKLAKLKREAVDKLVVQEAVLQVAEESNPERQLKKISTIIQGAKCRFMSRPDPAKMPALLFDGEGQWAVVRGQSSRGYWVLEYFAEETNNWIEKHQDDLQGRCLADLSLVEPFTASKSPIYKLIKREMFASKRPLLEALLASIVINVVAIASAFYTMQVYDRVIPTAATQTLLVLTLGVALVVLYEWLAKHLRARLFERVIDAVDQRLARAVYMRFLAVRLDQLPPSVGSLASQMKGYETVRSLLTAVTSHVLIDAPFSFLYIALIYLIAGPLALIPFGFFLVSVVVGNFYRGRIDDLSTNINHAVNYKTGLLVESVEGAETIKSGQGGWRMLSRWMNTTDAARNYELEMRRIAESSQHMIAAFQQASYITLVATGALMASQGELTMGSLIACSILSGRILAPVASIPNTLQQWSHAKSSIKSLDAVWKLEDDHAGVDVPLVPESIHGHYRVHDAVMVYGDKVAINVANLNIKPGEKVGILGPVGSGKTSLLRLLSGMYKPQQGKVFLDDMDLAQISKPVLADSMGYLQQEGRLFAGTLRDNLVLGLMDPGDNEILRVAKQTGLYDTVIASHPDGMQQPIHEGGQGLSGGQRQLVNLTRVFLRSPAIWLLDEPTASMDAGTESRAISAFNQVLDESQTLLMVTHKMEMLQLVDRIVVVAKNQIVLDGEKQQVLNQLQSSKAKSVEVDA